MNIANRKGSDRFLFSGYTFQQEQEFKATREQILPLPHMGDKL
jgi:hypothetical protein